jgi:uncharacterized protein YuzE
MRTIIPLELRLDESVDCAYVTLSADIKRGNAVRQIVVEAEGLRGDIVIDLDGQDNVLGIEFIGYKSMLG